jgi:hypothetical protein
MRRTRTVEWSQIGPDVTGHGSQAEQDKRGLVGGGAESEMDMEERMDMIRPDLDPGTGMEEWIKSQAQ